MMEINTENYNQRFGGVIRLYGFESAEKIFASHVLVIGLGGVGSWAAESLARSGVSKISLCDLDDICITNTNRQIHALDGEYGKSKAISLKDRLIKINPDLNVNIIEDFFTEKNAEQILDTKYDFIIDAFDSANNKCLLIKKCIEKNIPLIVTGGTAGKIDPTQIKIDDLGFSINDSLLFRIRKLLRREHGFHKEAKLSFAKRKKIGVFCVYSPEEPNFPTSNGGVCKTPEPGSNLILDCESGMGSITHVTASFGLFAAGFVVNQLSKK